MEPDPRARQPRPPRGLLSAGSEASASLAASGVEIVGVAGTDYVVEWEGQLRRLLWPETGRPYAEGLWVEGRREGVHRAWYENGQLLSVDNWTAGKREGRASSYYEDGLLMREGDYESGFRNGEWSEWHPNGVLAKIGSYEHDGKGQYRSGYWVFYDLRGEVNWERTGHYVHGNLVR